ncbi:hypothetical protein K1W54_15700 [Micromonospora sp. CPCC 205371]|nr:hypothetical protein [Micromonospora sp. CPCC 205371]
MYERGLTYGTTMDEVHLIDADPNRDVYPWHTIADVVERPVRSPLARLLLPPPRRYRAYLVLADGSALVLTGAVKDARQLAAAVRDRIGGRT